MSNNVSFDVQIYAIYDRLSASFGEPFPAVSDAVARRRFDYVMASAPMVSGDCDLYCIAAYDTTTGVVEHPFSDSVQPRFICHYEVPVNV